MWGKGGEKTRKEGRRQGKGRKTYCKKEGKVLQGEKDGGRKDKKRI
jgi:hypothetical protein